MAQGGGNHIIFPSQHFVSKLNIWLMFRNVSSTGAERTQANVHSFYAKQLPGDEVILQQATRPVYTAKMGKIYLQ